MTYSGSIKPFSRGYSTGSGDTGKYEAISGSSIYTFKGGTGGIFERFNSLNFSPSGSDGNGPNNRFGITQSWNEDIITNSGSTIYVRDDQREFYNGEFSGSAPFIKLQRGTEVDPCYPFLNWENVPEFLYRLEYFSGSDNNFTIEPFVPQPPVILNEYYANATAGNGYFRFRSNISCNNSGSIPIFANSSNINNITIGTRLYADVSGEVVWQGSDQHYGLRISSSADNTFNSFTVQIDNNGIVQNKITCVLPVSFRVRETNSLTEYNVNYDSTYSIGDYVNISNASGCYEIIEIINATSPDEINNDGTITVTCTPVTNFTLTEIGYHDNFNDYFACKRAGRSDSISIDADAEYLSLATRLFNVGTTLAAPAGTYSDGSGYRDWNGIVFTSNYRGCSVD